MALNIDTSRALRTHAELTSLVKAIKAAPTHEPETDAVEWKSEWDLTKSEARFETAKDVLGFGNRTVPAASQAFEGCAYFVAGVEPQNLVGVQPIDPAQIDDQLAKYIHPGQPRWSPQYVTVGGAIVLVITVEAPRQGDPTFTLQRGFNEVPAGRIFLRRHGKTEEAGPADIRALEQRLVGGRPRVELTVTRADDDGKLCALQLSDNMTEEWVEREVAQLLAPLESEPPGSYQTFGSQLTRDRRRKDEFRQEVEEYKQEAGKRFLFNLVVYAMRRKLAVVRLQVVNRTDRNFEGVEVVVTLPAGVLAWMSEDDAWDDIRPPRRPKPWSKDTLASSIIAPPLAATTPLNQPKPGEVDRDGARQSVRFAPRHVRPGDTVHLHPIYLMLPQRTVGTTISLNWRVTSTGVDGWQEDEVSYDVDATPVALTLIDKDSLPLE